jgi:aprataxin
MSSNHKSIIKRTKNNCEDAITADEMTGETTTDAPSRKKPRNACKHLFSMIIVFRKVMRCPVTELMSAKPESSHPDSHKRPKGMVTKSGLHFPGRDGLEAYIVAPESFLESEIVYHNENWVLIRDLYPKASVHLLLLPRDLKISHIFPAYKAFNSNPEFLNNAKVEAEKAAQIAASELRRQFSSVSASEETRVKAMEADDPPTELPEGRNWRKEIKIGIHKVPTMSNLHIHIISRDMHSASMKHRKHYNSFNTPFFVPLTDFPLNEEHEALLHGERYLESDMRCWNCGMNFGNQFKKLKSHLESEWEVWRKL